MTGERHAEVSEGAVLDVWAVVLRERSRLSPVKNLPAEFDARIKRVDELLDRLVALKAAKAARDHADFRDLIWRVGCR